MQSKAPPRMFVHWTSSAKEAPITKDFFSLNDTDIVTDSDALGLNATGGTPSPEAAAPRNLSSLQLPPDHFYFDHPEEMLMPWAVNEYFFYIVVTYLVTFVIGVSGNLVVISVFARDRTSRDVTSVSLASLAVSDLLLLIICAPLDVAQYFLVQWRVTGAVCKLVAYAETVSAFGSVLAWSQSRLKGIYCCSLTQNVIQTTFTNLRTSVIIYSCKDEHDWQGQSVSWYRLVTLFVLPSLIMIVCCSLVIVELWVSTKTMDELTQASNFIDQWQAPMTPRQGSLPTAALQQASCRLILRGHANSDIRDVKKARQQVMKILILVVILFLLCWGPRLVMEIVIKCCLNVFDHGVYVARVVFYLLPFVHSCLNPIVYCFMSRKFRRRMVRCFHRTYFGSHCRAKAVFNNTRCSSRNGTRRLGSTNTFTSHGTSTVAVPSSMTPLPGETLAL